VCPEIQFSAELSKAEQSRVQSIIRGRVFQQNKYVPDLQADFLNVRVGAKPGYPTKLFSYFPGKVRLVSVKHADQRYALEFRKAAIVAVPGTSN
jgi:hypothetical protein